jgi:flagellar protein FliS
MNRGFSAYKKINTMGMSQLDLILTVYRGAMEYLDRAQSDFKEGQMNEGREACEKARKCIVHLYTTLDMDKGGAIASHLGRLYAYMIEQIDLGMASKSDELFDNVRGILGNIKEAWEDLKDKETALPIDDISAKEVRPVVEAGETSPESGSSPNGNRLTFSA